MKKLLLILLLFAFLPLVAGQEFRFIGQEDAILDIREPCINNNTFCSATAECNLTTWLMNGDVIIDNQVMSNNVAYHNFTLNETHNDAVGEYEDLVICCDGILCNYETFFHEITPSGERPSIAKSILYIASLTILVIFLIFSFVLIYKSEWVVWKVMWFGVSWLFLIGITFIAWDLSADFLTANSFIVSFFYYIFLIVTFALIPIVFGIFFYSAYILFWQSRYRELIEGRGLDEQQAEDMMSRRKQKW